MVNLGKKTVRTSRDGWTVFAKDRKPSAHYEHTVALKRDSTDILSDHEVILKAIRKNPDVREVTIKTATA
ncbi:MAG: type I methionyl aminopeptidase, partial [Saprospiraceae bacterium]|nr:type I methionyl aminopeptidase [Saprospiraceae bacterium]